MSDVQISTQRIDLIGQIDRQVGDSGRKVSVGQAIQAMVLNGLGFVNRPLYLTPEFYANKPVELLIGPGITAEDLNDDCLGRALDKVVRVGVTEIYYHLAAYALKVMGIVNRFAHTDTSAFSVEGANEIEEENAIKITFGHSKDHRPDLKQAMLGLICANTMNIPVWLEALDGNRSDKKALVSMVSAYIKHFSAEEETPYIIADSTLYGAKNLKELAHVLWVTRVPATLKEAQKLLTTIAVKEMTTGTDGYFYYEQTVTYGGVEQRWLLVLSQKSRKRELLQRERAIAKERNEAKRVLKKLAREQFSCEADALLASERVQKGLKYHQLKVSATSIARHAKRGRPAAHHLLDTQGESRSGPKARDSVPETAGQVHRCHQSA